MSIYLTDDVVYLENENLLNEYVLNDRGVIFAGNHRQIGGRPWNFGQVLFLLKTRTQTGCIHGNLNIHLNFFYICGINLWNFSFFPKKV